MPDELLDGNGQPLEREGWYFWKVFNSPRPSSAVGQYWGESEVMRLAGAHQARLWVTLHMLNGAQSHFISSSLVPQRGLCLHVEV